MTCGRDRGLEGPGRERMAARIKAARELGDLKENAEYHIAKDDQAHLETRIKRLRGKLKSAVVVEADRDAGAFAFGRTAEVLDEAAGEIRTWTLVGSTELIWRPAVSQPSRPSAVPCWTPRRARRSRSNAPRRQELSRTAPRRLGRGLA